MILIINKGSAGLPDADNCFPRHLEIFDERKSFHADWTVAHLGKGKCFMGAARLGYEVIFAEGQYSTKIDTDDTTIYLDSVEIFNLNTGTISYDRLSSKGAC